MQTNRNGSRREQGAGADGERARCGPTLVVEGALDPAGAAVVLGGEIVSCQEIERRAEGRGLLFRAVRRALDEAALGPEGLRAFAAGTGPGSLTGLRVALGLVRGLAAAAQHGTPVFGADSLRLLVASSGVVEPAIVALPWGRARVLLAEIDPSSGRRTEPRLVPVDGLQSRSELAGRTVVHPRRARGLEWPEGARPVAAEMSGVRTLATLAAAGEVGRVDAGRGPTPAYLVPPDAVLPARSARLPPGYRAVVLDESDLGDLIGLERACFDEPWSRGLLASELVPAGDRMAVGARAPGGELAAAAVGRFGVDAVEILRVATATGHRRRGLGRRLVRDLLERGRRRGLGRAEIELRADNEPAAALYLAEGFVVVGRRRGYYRDGEDALLMTAVLRRAAR